MRQTEINTVWTYNGVEIELDLSEVDVLERYDNAFNKMSEQEKKTKRDVPNHVFARSYCDLFHQLFDDLFGDGVFEKLTGGKVYNMMVINDLYESFIDFASAQTAQISKEQNRLASRYSPNRDARRAAAKGAKVRVL